ncbi:hypothetical protein [Streptomyces sp. NPDC006551]|uniref:hypothetical protein n=1 Tax=Streptomyces sp. NPDC006551 TaxID=3157178 RepID=UPI0033A8E65B
MAEEPTHLEIFTQVADIKMRLAQETIRSISAENLIRGDIFGVSQQLVAMQKDIKDIHEEVTKAVSTEFLEGMGLDGFAAALEKFWEGKNIVPYLASALLGLFVPAMMFYLNNKFNNLSRTVREAVSRDGTFRAYDENGDLTRQTRQQIEGRERRVANGGTSVADLDRNTDFDPLRLQLERLNPALEKFNEHAGPFTRAFGRLPKVAAMTTAAEAIDKVGKAVSETDVQELRSTAGAIKRLVNATQNFNPRKIPKANSLSSAADAAKRLADNTNDAGRAFDFLKEKALAAAAAI